ncbi:MAG: hypothetical protein AB7I13_10460 [Vicinamibacterales bacterium]
MTHADLAELIAERAAIMEFDAGVPRAECMALAEASVRAYLEECDG